MANEVTLGEGASVSDFVLYSYVLNSVASFVSMCVCVCVGGGAHICICKRIDK
jgi:hypothetical protein